MVDGQNDLSLPQATLDVAAEAPVQPLAQQDASLIRLDQFRADIRFAGINGQGPTRRHSRHRHQSQSFLLWSGCERQRRRRPHRLSFDFTGANSTNANDVNGHGSNVGRHCRLSRCHIYGHGSRLQHHCSQGTLEFRQRIFHGCRRGAAMGRRQPRGVQHRFRQYVAGGRNEPQYHNTSNHFERRDCNAQEQ